MLLKRDGFLEALRAPDPEVRLWLVHGRSDEDVHALAAAAVRALGGEIRDLAAADLADAPGRLRDEAASLPMFGGRPLIRVIGADNRATAAVEALLEAPAAGNPVVMLAGELRKDSPLAMLASTHRLARSVVAYGVEPREGKAGIEERARAAGLRLDAAAAERLWAASHGSLLVAEREIEKIATYLLATPDTPRRVEQDILDLLLANDDVHDLGGLIDAVVGGDMAALDRELRAAPSPIPIFRALGARLLILLDLAEAVARGTSAREAVEAARPPIFWKDRGLTVRALRQWRPERVRAAIAALLDAERAIKTPGSAGDRIGHHAILSVARGGAVEPLLGRGARPS